MTNIKKLSVVLLLIITISGCFNDVKEANKTNFTTSINMYLKSDKQNLNCFDLPGTPPMQENKRNKDRLEFLATSGFLESKSVKRVKQNRNFFGINLEPNKKKKEYENVVIYNLTDNAKPFYKKGFVRHGVCVGKVAVKEIIKFTPPVKSFLGNKVSKVKYSYIHTDFPSWVKLKEVKEKTKKTALFLSDDGWVHEKLLTL